MKGVGGSAERLHSGPGGPSGPNQWEMVAMDYVDLNDLVPQVFFLCLVFTIQHDHHIARRDYI